MDSAGFKRDIDRVSDRNPLLEMSTALLSLRHSLLPSNYTFVVKFLIKLKREMKIYGFANLQRNHSILRRNDQADSARTHIP
jgi:hypothetical protein